MVLATTRKYGKIGADIGQIYTAFLPDVFHSQTSLSFEVDYEGCESGTDDRSRGQAGQGLRVSDCSLRNWLQQFHDRIGNGFVMALMERMLGAGTRLRSWKPEVRPLSQIELDLAALVLDRIAGVLRSSVNAPAASRPS